MFIERKAYYEVIKDPVGHGWKLNVTEHLSFISKEKFERWEEKKKLASHALDEYFKCL